MNASAWLMQHIHILHRVVSLFEHIILYIVILAKARLHFIRCKTKISQQYCKIHILKYFVSVLPRPAINFVHCKISLLKTKPWMSPVSKGSYPYTLPWLLSSHDLSKDPFSSSSVILVWFILLRSQAASFYCLQLHFLLNGLMAK